MNLDEIEKLARGATAGPWDIVKRGEWEKEFRGSCGRRFMSHRSVREQDTKYIAAANPDAVLKLIAVVRAAKNMKGQKSIGLAAALAALELGDD